MLSVSKNICNISAVVGMIPSLLNIFDYSLHFPSWSSIPIGIFDLVVECFGFEYFHLRSPKSGFRLISTIICEIKGFSTGKVPIVL